MRIPFFNNEDQKPNNEQIVNVNVENITPNPYQPRQSFSEDKLQELADSIASYGVIQPLTVRKIDEDKQYQLIAGERRLRAVKLLGKTEVPVIIKNLENREMAEIALIENLQRKDLNFIEEAEAYNKLIEEFNLTQTELATRIGKAQSTIANKLRLLNLPGSILHVIQQGGLNERQARALLKLDKKDDMLDIVEEAVRKDLNVRETEELVNKVKDSSKEELKEAESGKITGAFADIRLYLNTIEKTINQLDEAGANFKVERLESEDAVEFHIRIKREQAGQESD
ncbi:ParB/RepB/Spo0J family partition protein [Halanaerobiaceae bacterium Z-7014]|uniref:ParB/RepB/Spo0J family partition protein n=1 Tax=Halonatronomonas betaini TaxID=2778430 RepID=A0A931AT71_9FIRM|nr:ParB/RepB/Spo0J family partition protein [Halonatronomonas betaini]MBF8437704.1 ParB/RepB/Spo0J family partition protein [Halonatronomonas betaini]